jgi:hypothetical protein
MTRLCSTLVAPPVSHLCRLLGAFLLDNDADELGGRISLTNFRIIAAIYEYDNGIARCFLFSSSNGSGGGGWTMAASKEVNLASPRSRILFAGNVAESVYWTTGRDILLLDKHAAELRLSSIISLGDSYPYLLFASRSGIVRCQDGTVCISILEVEQNLSVKVLIQADGKWVQEKSIELPMLIPEVQSDHGKRIHMKIVSVAEGSITLGMEGVGLISVDLATMEFKRVDEHCRNMYHGPAYMYQLPWPPTIRACLP